VNRAITLRYLGSASGYGVASYIYGPETPRATQVAAAKAACQSASSSGSGYRQRIEIWSDFFTRQVFTVKFLNYLGPK